MKSFFKLLLIFGCGIPKAALLIYISIKYSEQLKILVPKNICSDEIGKAKDKLTFIECLQGASRFCKLLRSNSEW